MFDYELESWWQNVTPEMQSGIQQGCLAIAALICGYVVGVLVTRTLADVRFDETFGLPGAAPSTADEKRRITPSLVAGVLVCLTVWAGAVWWVAYQHGLTEVAGPLATTIKRTWGFAGLLAAFLTLGNMLAHRLTSCLRDEPPATRFQSSDLGKPLEVSHGKLAGAVGAGAYVLVLLLVLLVVADSFDWPLSRSAVAALWQFSQNVLLAVAALFIGCLGARWARDMITTDNTKSPEKRFAEYMSATLVGVTTVFAVGVLLFGARVLVAVAAVSVVGFLVWSVRAYLRDVTAGWHLRAYKIAEVRLDSEQPWHIVETGLLTSTLSRSGEFRHVRNHKLLEICVQGVPS